MYIDSIASLANVGNYFTISSHPRYAMPNFTDGDVFSFQRSEFVVSSFSHLFGCSAVSRFESFQIAYVVGLDLLGISINSTFENVGQYLFCNFSKKFFQRCLMGDLRNVKKPHIYAENRHFDHAKNLYSAITRKSLFSEKIGKISEKNQRKKSAKKCMHWRAARSKNRK